jgi:hypothetical protein
VIVGKLVERRKNEQQAAFHDRSPYAKANRGCHCWVVQQCGVLGNPALLVKPAVAPKLRFVSLYFNQAKSFALQSKWVKKLLDEGVQDESFMALPP